MINMYHVGLKKCNFATRQKTQPLEKALQYFFDLSFRRDASMQYITAFKPYPVTIIYNVLIDR